MRCYKATVFAADLADRYGASTIRSGQGAHAFDRELIINELYAERKNIGGATWSTKRE